MLREEEEEKRRLFSLRRDSYFCHKSITTRKREFNYTTCYYCDDPNLSFVLLLILLLKSLSKLTNHVRAPSIFYSSDLNRKIHFIWFCFIIILKSALWWETQTMIFCFCCLSFLKKILQESCRKFSHLRKAMLAFF